MATQFDSSLGLAQISVVRRWVASLLLLVLVAATAAPPRLPEWFESLWATSTISDPIGHDTEIRAAQTASPLAVEPSQFRLELGAPSTSTKLWSPRPELSDGAAVAFAPRVWLRDRRASIRRSCRRTAPPELPAASARV